MKIQCPCGGLITDGSDYLPHKAYLVADQDESASWDEHPENDLARFETTWRLKRMVYECQACRRLCIDVGSDLIWYVPESGRPTGALGSKLGSAFRVHLRGLWNPQNNPPGELWWGGSGDIPGGFERHRSLVLLRERYAEVRTQLLSEDRLRNAFLSIDGEIVEQDG